MTGEEEAGMVSTIRIVVVESITVSGFFIAVCWTKSVWVNFDSSSMGGQDHRRTKRQKFHASTMQCMYYTVSFIGARIEKKPQT
jgi:hypothetical protein